MTDNRNTILAVILSGLVLIAWQYFYNVPQMEKQRAQTQVQAELAKPSPQATPGSTARLPDRDTVWQQEGSGSLSPSNPVTLKYDNGDGLTFRRIIAIDDRYLFTCLLYTSDAADE